MRANRTHNAFHEIKKGRVKATIWHETESGITRYNVAFTRTVDDPERWWEASSFQRSDMPAVAKLAEDVNAWICLQSEDDD